MAKLYPPILEGIIPACAKPDDSNNISMTIPFVMNRSVGVEEISGINVKFKTIGGTELGIYEASMSTPGEITIEGTNGEIYIDNLPASIDSKMQIQQYYKIQLAYRDIPEQQGDTPEVGYYSSVGVFKFTAEPIIECRDIVNGYLYRGFYTPNDLDKTEKFYSYYFELQYGHVDNNKFIVDEVIDKTEEKLHMNPETNYEDYYITKELEGLTNNNYRVMFYATSVNKYKGADGRRIKAESLDPFPVPEPGEIFTLNVTENYDNGYFDISVDGGTLPNTYSYILWRYDENTGWTKLSSLFLQSVGFRDYTIEHGINYKYALQGEPIEDEEEEERNATEKLQSQYHTAKFEDMFLSDHDRQLKIRFNPKVNTYKRTLLESKIDTIGGKYPIITRNGNVDYREIGIGGLISYLEDEEGLFDASAARSNDAYRQETASIHNDQPQNSTSLGDANRYKERKFREEVLEWLSNGEPKYFRSNAEGNHIVRLMNVSLTPNDTVARLIYSFSASSYEIADNTYENIIKYNLGQWRA